MKVSIYEFVTVVRTSFKLFQNKTHVMLHSLRLNFFGASLTLTNSSFIVTYSILGKNFISHSFVTIHVRSWFTLEIFESRMRQEYFHAPISCQSLKTLMNVLLMFVMIYLFMNFFARTFECFNDRKICAYM